MTHRLHKSALQSITAKAVLDLADGGCAALIDVRSEGEFAQGAIPGFQNAPILTNAERHQVGLTYKTQGSDAALTLGQQIVGPHLADRVANWTRLASAFRDQAIITCWRGGLRSQLACEQMATAGCSALQVEGGYKAMRRELMQLLASPPAMIVIGGLTGSGKTRLIKSLPMDSKIDLEHLARHRGSAFGAELDCPQPSQASFENAIAMTFRRVQGHLVLEDESRYIGRLRLPTVIYNAMQEAPIVWIESDLQSRAERLYFDYIDAPLRDGVAVDTLMRAVADGIHKLTSRLGSKVARAILQNALAALDAKPVEAITAESQVPWIKDLLLEYYDKRYNFALLRSQRKLAYRGSFEECRQWICQRYV